MAGTDETSHGDATSDRLQEILMIAQAELRLKTGSFDHWKYYGELHDMKRRPLSPDWLRAAIAWGVIGRIRPARVTGYLRKLRAHCEKANETEQFEAFQGLLNTHLAPARLSNHGFDRTSFADLDHETVWEQVKSHLAALSHEGYEVFLNSGTLLGVVRDKKLIDHDDDVDLAIILKATNTRDAAEEWNALRGKLERLGLFDAENFKSDPIYKLKPIGSVQIDLFPAWQEDGKFFVYPHTHGVLPAKDVLPLRMCELTGHALPARPEKMLAVNYGDGWRHPDPLFKFPWASANKAFAPFLKELGA